MRESVPWKAMTLSLTLGLFLLWAKLLLVPGSGDTTEALPFATQQMDQPPKAADTRSGWQTTPPSGAVAGDGVLSSAQNSNKAGRGDRTPPHPPYASSVAGDPRAGCGHVAEGDNTITIYVQNPRTGGMFLSGKFGSFSTSSKYTYVVRRFKDMTPRPTKSEDLFLEEMCNKTPGFKIIVYDSGATPNFVLKLWPAHTVLVMTGDESGRWGLYHSKRYWGPFGDDKEVYFDHNRTSPHRHILLPPTIAPWYRQYFDPKQQSAFGPRGDVLYMPLGPRAEFPSFDPSDIVQASKRKYMVSLMASNTDASRKRLTQVLVNDTLIPESKKYLHMAKNWHPEVTNEAYVAPKEYGRIMLDSIFTPCPKGRSLDTFRLYEAMEAGSIPVIELQDGYAREHLPPPYFKSPMVFVERWDDAPETMARLAADPMRINQRQREVMAWYKAFMGSVTTAIEAKLEERKNRAK
eukprot:m.77130 g.77130  ORF g.77130 m.77130 type:complete len:462 (+) comp14537_c1_seq3:3177-4562(+)